MMKSSREREVETLEKGGRREMRAGSGRGAREV